MSTALARLQRTRAQHAAALPSDPPFSSNKNQEDIFSHLLRNGKMEDALCVYRAHAPFKEFDAERIPALLQRHLPPARKKRLLSFAAFSSLLDFIETEIAPQLSGEASELLSELAETQTSEILLRSLPDEYDDAAAASSLSSQREETITQTLQLCMHIARCGKLSLLEELVGETFRLYAEHHVLRPARVLYCIDDKTATASSSSKPSRKRRFEMDAEAFLWRIVACLAVEEPVNALQQASADHIVHQLRAWCAGQSSSSSSSAIVTLERCVSNFLSAHPHVLREHPHAALHLVTLLQQQQATDGDSYYAKAITLCISAFPAPYPAKLWAMLGDDGSGATWDKELKQMRMREISAKYVASSSATFDMSKHFSQLQRHMCALAGSSAADYAAFESIVEDLFRISPQYEHGRVALWVLQHASHNVLLEEPVDRVERVKRVLCALPSVEDKLLVCQEAIQYMLACCEEEEEEETETDADDGDVDRVLTANWGDTLCHFAASELALASSASSYAALVYLDLEACEARFRAALSRLLLLPDAAPPAAATMADCTTSSPEIDALVAKLLGDDDQAAVHSQLLDRVNDELVMLDVRACCDKSLTRQNILPGRFRDCPNVLDGAVLGKTIQLALNSQRRAPTSAAAAAAIPQQRIGAAPVGSELDAYSAMFFREGAYQLALRFKAHIALHFSASSSPDEVKLDYMLSTLLRNGLEETVLDESLVLGYLLAAPKRDTVLSTLNTQINRFKYDEEEYLRFERLCWMGKLVTAAAAGGGDHDHYARQERVFYWFKRLREMAVDFDKVKLFECSAKEVQLVSNRLFALVFDPETASTAAAAAVADAGMTTAAERDMDSFLLAFPCSGSGGPRPSSVVLAHSLVAALDGLAAYAFSPSASAAVCRWAARCDLAVLVPALDRMSVAVITTTQDGGAALSSCNLSRVRLALDVLVELYATSNNNNEDDEEAEERYVARLVLVEVFGGSAFAQLVRDPVRAAHKMRRAFQSFSEPELCKLVSRGLLSPSSSTSASRRDFVRAYAVHQVQEGDDIADVLQVLEQAGDISSHDESVAHFQLDTALALKRQLEARSSTTTTTPTTSKDELELARFAHSLFPRKAELQTEVEHLERVCVFQDFGLSYPPAPSSSSEQHNPSSPVYHPHAPEFLLRAFYEQCAAAASTSATTSSNKRGMFPAALLIMRGDVDLWKKTLQRCIVDWLQQTSTTAQAVDVIYTALQHMQREAGIDADQFLTGIAFMSSARIKKIAIVRALKVLRKFRALHFNEEELLWMKTKELEMGECGIWKQKIEQVVHTANKPASVLGLLREIPPACVNPEKEVRGLCFVAGLIVDFSLYGGAEESSSSGAGLLETCLGRLVECNAEACLRVMLDIPADKLGAVKDLAIWSSLQHSPAVVTAAGGGAYVQLLERCPFDHVVRPACEYLLRASSSASSHRARIAALLHRTQREEEEE